MYTTEKSEIGKLRAYRKELNERYAAALERHDWTSAHKIRDVRRKVNRSILLYEEWNADRTVVPTSIGSLVV